MKRYSNQTCNGRRLMISNILALSLLLLATYPAPSAPQKAAQPAWQVPVPSGKIGKGPFIISNPCPEPHFLKVTNDRSYVRFEPASGIILVGPKSSAGITVVFDATLLEAGTYSFDLLVVCEDCKSGSNCKMRESKRPVELKVTGPPSQKQSRNNVDSATFTALFAEFLETLGRLKQEPWARKQENARLLESIADSIKRLKEKSDSSPAQATERYVESLRMNLDALKNLVGSTTGSEKRPSAIELARFRSSSHLVTSALTENPAERGHTSQGVRGASPKAKFPPAPTKRLEVVDEDLKIKAQHSEYAAKSTEGWPALVQVSVVTKKDNKIVNGLEVWSVPRLHEDDPDERERFSTFTSPSGKALAPGSYFIGIKHHEGELQRIGGDGRPDQQVDLRAP